MNLKKHINILLAMLILVSNVGLAFNVHYCGDSVASVSLTSIAKEVNDKDCCGTIIEKSSCCKDKKIKIEKKSDNSILKTFSFQLEIPIVNYDWKPSVFDMVLNFKNFQKQHYYCDANAPPFYKLYSQYIFYA